MIYSLNDFFQLRHQDLSIEDYSDNNLLAFYLLRHLTILPFLEFA